MDFTFSEEQIMFRNMTRKFAEQEILPTLRILNEKESLIVQLLTSGSTWTVRASYT